MAQGEKSRPERWVHLTISGYMPRNTKLEINVKTTEEYLKYVI